MSYPIKFRVWDKEEKAFVPPDQVAIDGKGVLYTYDKVENRFVKETLGLEISWFTGLQDKNGKEIYEGDFLEVQGLTFVVLWDRIDSAFEMKTNNFVRIIMSGICNYLTIVGNVYENPNRMSL